MKPTTHPEVREIQWQTQNWQRKLETQRIRIACEFTGRAGLSLRFWLVLQNLNSAAGPKEPTYTTRGQKYLYRDGWKEPFSPRGRVNFSSLSAAVTGALAIDTPLPCNPA